MARAAGTEAPAGRTWSSHPCPRRRRRRRRGRGGSGAAVAASVRRAPLQVGAGIATCGGGAASPLARGPMGVVVRRPTNNAAAAAAPLAFQRRARRGKSCGAEAAGLLQERPTSPSTHRMQRTRLRSSSRFFGEKDPSPARPACLPWPEGPGLRPTRGAGSPGSAPPMHHWIGGHLSPLPSPFSSPAPNSLLGVKVLVSPHPPKTQNSSRE